MRKNLLILLVLIGLGAAVYANTLKNGFQFDDLHVIVNNPFVKDIGFIPEFFIDAKTFSTLPENSSYRPLSSTVFTLLWHIGNGTPLAFRIYQILLHILMGFMVFVVSSILLAKSQILADPEFGFLKLTPRFIGSVSAAIFLVHPGLSESVNYITCISTIQSAFLVLVSLWCFTKSASSKLYLMPMSLCFGLALLTKEDAAVFPLLCLLYVILVAGRHFNFKEKLRTYGVGVAFGFLVLGAFISVYYFANSDVLFVNRGSVSIASYFLTQVYAWLYYLVWAVLPWGYSIEHLDFGFIHNISNPKFIIGVFGFLSILWLSILWSKEKNNRKPLTILSFGFLGFVISLLPASSVIVLAEPINEHRYYLGYAFLIPALIYGLLYFLKSFKALSIRYDFNDQIEERDLLNTERKPLITIGLFSVSLILLVVLTIFRNQVWKSPKSLWEDVAKKDPQNGRAFNNLGSIYMEANEYRKALSMYRKCAEVWPSYKYCYIGLHQALMKTGDLSEAAQAIEQAHKLDPNSVLVLEHLGRFQVKKREYKEAVKTLKECSKKSEGKYLECQRLLVEALWQLNRKEEAIPYIRNILILDPSSRDLEFRLGLYFIERQDWYRAEGVFSYLLRKDPNDIRSAYNLAWLQMQVQNWSNALEMWKKVVRLKPDLKDAWANLQFVAEKLGERRIASEAKKKFESLH